MRSAWGAVPVAHLPTATGDNEAFDFQNAATPDGQWLVGTIVPRDFISNTTRLSYLALYNVHSRQIMLLRALLHPQSQVLGASADAHWIAWSEADDQPSFFDWTMFALNRDTGRVIQLARAPRQNGQPAPGPSSPPVVDNGQVTWSQATAAVTPGDPTSLNKVVVRLEDLATGAVTTLATAGGQATLAWPWAAWAHSTGGGDGYVALKNLITGQELHLQQQPATFVLAGTSLAYDDSESVTLVDDITKNLNDGTIVASAANPGDHLEFVSLGDRLVAWNEQSTQPPVWDRAQHRLVILPVQNGMSDSWVGRRVLLWFEPEPAAQQARDERNGLIPTPTLNVVDTTVLPITPPK